MLKIERASNGRVVLRLSGAIEGDELAELDRVIRLEQNGARLALDLENVTRVDREGMRFLRRCDETGTVLQSCPGYLREWIARDREPSGR